MPFASSVIDVVLQLVGLFYAFAGYVGVRAVHQARLIDAAMDELAKEVAEDKTPPREHQRMLWLLLGALLTLAGGVALLLQAEMAAWLFFASAALQFIYLLVAAPYYFDRAEKPDGRGRQQTTNATILYAAATVFILWAAQAGRLKALADIPVELTVAAAAGIAIYSAYAIAKFLKPFGFARSKYSSAVEDEDSDPPSSND